MKSKLISVTLITVLLCTVLGSNICCTTEPTTQYDLIIDSTAGGDVTTPGEGTFNYTAGAEVNLTATSDADYHFVEWTAPAGTFTNANAAQTTFTMPAQDVTVTANFGFDMTFIVDVPDTNQPPTNTLPTLNPIHYCAPMAMVNILEYWDDVMNHANAQNVTAGLIPETAAEYLGWFMHTNGKGIGKPPRVNPGVPGTYDLDIGPGTLEFVRWDIAHPYPPAPPPALPAGKLGYNWSVLMSCDTDYDLTLDLYKNEIDAGRPLVVSFDFWNPVDKDIAVTDPETGETIDVFVWGDKVPSSGPPDPVEYWSTGDIGHAVTGVGYKLNWDPDGAGGPIPSADWVIVHDNWATTPENVAIPWLNWMCLFPVSP